MLLMLDNYDSFTYNIVQYFGELGQDVNVVRNDEISVPEIARLKPDYLVVGPGPCAPQQVPVLGLPACGMFHRITIFDLILPRVLCGEKITRQDIARLGHGGLCRQCKICAYPICGFGK